MSNFLDSEDTLQSWSSSLIAKRGGRFGKPNLLVCCGQFRNPGNGIVFRSKDLSLQKLIFSFVNLLSTETKLSIVDGPSTLMAFIDW